MVVPSRYHSPMKRDNPLTNIQSYTCARLSENRISHSVLCLKKINPEKPDVPLNKNDAFQKVQKRHVQEKR